MPFIKIALGIAAAVWVTAGAAWAAPVVIDPNFDGDSTSGPHYYGIAAWGAVALPKADPAYNPSFAGSVGFDAFNQWNNGKPGNGATKVGFLANNGAYISQAINGFTVGKNYRINLLVDGRVLNAQDQATVLARLDITTSSSGLVYSANVLPVDLAQTSNNLFTSISTASFAANAPTVTVRLSNTGGAASTVLVSGFTITETVSANAGTLVPEPASMLVLGAGLFGIAIAARRKEGRL